ncbi:MAG: hypothetical protein LBU89_12535 [Fibromonadaceae bacterium]|jgi:ElaB/YqjD/DUF883 family membrane-anchored ribosome-binding protein|nr:hypothetical protein [Fibromonadaceae bacterium]
MERNGKSKISLVLACIFVIYGVVFGNDVSSENCKGYDSINCSLLKEKLEIIKNGYSSFENLNKKLDSYTSLINKIFVISIGLVVISIGLVVLSIVNLFRFRSIIKRIHDSNNSENDIVKAIDSVKSKIIQENKNDLKELKKEFESLIKGSSDESSANVGKQHGQEQSSLSYGGSFNTQENVFKPPMGKPEFQQREFWVSAPWKGIFTEDNIYKVYKCKISKENKDEAEFYFSNDSSCKDAYFENIKERIYDLAEIEGHVDKNSSIHNISCGILKRAKNDSNSWELKKKAIIKFS